MKIVFMGTPDFAVPILEGLIEKYGVALVVTQPDKKTGRHQNLVSPPIKQLAEEKNIPVIQPIKIREDYSRIVEEKPDIIITCAYGQIIPKELLDLPRLGCINVHASLLPKLRGGAPIHKAIIDGYSKTGITIMYMDEKMDNGDIIEQKSIDILDTDNLESLYDKLSKLGKELLLEVLPSIIAGTNKRVKQNLDEVTFAYNISREEEKISFSKTSREILNLIRGLSPSPGAYLIFDDKEMKITKAEIMDKEYPHKKNGEIVEITKKGFIVKTNDKAILITEVKPFGKKKMDSSSFINGYGKEKLLGKVLE